MSWEDEGYSPRYFLTIGEAKVILDTLEIQFKEELTKWLFNSANQVEIIHDLEKIINRGRPAASDNINSIRAFSFISILLKKDQFDFIETREEEQVEENFKSIADEKEEEQVEESFKSIADERKEEEQVEESFKSIADERKEEEQVEESFKSIADERRREQVEESFKSIADERKEEEQVEKNSDLFSKKIFIHFLVIKT